MLPAQTPPDPLVITGRVVTFDSDQPVIDDGAVYIGVDELIADVQDAAAKPPDGFEDAHVIRTGGAVYPGLIDLHNHVAYNTISLWTSPGQTEAYKTRKAWQDDDFYAPMVGDPGKLLGYVAGKAQLKYAETKAIIGGVTAIQGSARTGHPYEGWLVRNIEEETFKTGVSTVYQSVVTLHVSKDEDPFPAARKHMMNANSFIYHLSEGTAPSLIGEYDSLRAHDCLHEGLLGIHCTALGQGNFAQWAPRGGTVVWSPFSNLWLYGQTTKVLEAKAAGLRLCLGADWSPSGSKSLLGELKVAHLYNHAQLNDRLSDEEICAMATRNPADALSWTKRLGRLKTGLRGDVLVTTDRGGGAYRNLIDSIESDVLLVTCNGYPMYGTPQLMRAAGAYELSEPIRIGAAQRRIRLTYDWIEDADWGWKQVLAEIDHARHNPRAYLKSHPHRKGSNVALEADKPVDLPKGINFDAKIPPLDSLFHDKAYLGAVKKGGFHNHQLDGLHRYYTGQP